MRPAIVLLALALFLANASARTWHVTPGGTGEAPTIQAAIDSSADGDVVLLADGTYVGDGNRDIDPLGKAVTVSSEAGDPSRCILDCEGNGTDPHRGFFIHRGEPAACTIVGITIRGGWAPFDGPLGFSVGGAVRICSTSAPTIRDCAFAENHAERGGGGLRCGYESNPLVVDCVFTGNSATFSGGGLNCYWNSSPAILRCTFLDNSAVYGGGVYCGSGSSPTFTEVLFQGNHGSEGGGMDCNSTAPLLTACTFYGNNGTGITSINGASVSLETSVLVGNTGGGVGCAVNGVASLLCCDLYGNPGGDWAGCIADQNGVNGNFSADPLFCDATIGDFTLQSDSPCLPGNHPNGADCGRIGAFGEGCGGSTSVIPTSWGSIKSRFR